MDATRATFILDATLHDRGWKDDDITAVTAGDFHRVATAAW